MILEYTEETKETELTDKAIEVRKRVASRNLQKALDNGIIDADALLEIKKSNKNQLQLFQKDNYNILNSEISSHQAVSRSDQHLEVINDFRILDRDVSRISRLGKEKIDTLNELEKRILLMRKKLFTPQPSSVQNDLQKEILFNGKKKIDELYTICERCNQRILNQMIEMHGRACNRITSSTNITTSVVSENISLSSTIDTTFQQITTFLPQPPRNFNIVSKGCTYIQWSWDPPVMDGGLNVFNYEIQYKVKIYENDEKTGRPLTYIQIMNQPISTSLWCFPSPIAHTGYNLNGLLAGCDYFDFEIRAQNEKGYSNWVDMLSKSLIKTIRTDDPDPPTAPLFFTLVNITSSCIYLQWEPPYFDGGRAITGYIISYIVLEREIGATLHDKFIETSHSFKVDAIKNTVIRNLPSLTTVKNVTIKARNVSGLVGQQSMINIDGTPEFSTRMASRNHQLKAQIKMALEIVEIEPTRKYIDTMFLSGYSQRVGVDDYIRLLAAELKITPEEPQEKQEEIEWLEIIRSRRERREKEAAQQAAQLEAIRLSELNEDTQRRKEKQLYVFTHLQRRGHFKIRILELEERMKRLNKESYFIDANRTELSQLMKRLQLRQIVLNQERDRVRGFVGTAVTSSVLHGAEQKYEIKSFKKDLDKACEDCAHEISSAKFKVIAGEDSKAIIKSELKKAESQMSDRRARFQLYMKVYEKDVRKQQKVLQMYDTDSLGEDKEQQDKMKRSSFSRLKSFYRYRKGLKVVILKTILGKLKRYYALAFAKWSRREFKLIGQNEISKGSTALNRVEAKRHEMQDILREILGETAKAKQQLDIINMPREPRVKMMSSAVFKLMEEGIDHVALSRTSGGLHFLYEGDGMARAAKFELARNLYEAQIISIRSRSLERGLVTGRVIMSPDDIKLLAITHGRMGKLFFMQNKLDRCLVEFDRQLSLAIEIQDEFEMADAYFGIGSGYMLKGEYNDAVRYLDTSQGKYAIIGNIQRQCMALKVLQQCYERKYESDVAIGVAKQISAIEGELSQKFKFMESKLASYSERLVKSSSADVEKSILIERCTSYSLNIRHQIQSLVDSIPIIDENRQEQEHRIQAQYKLLSDIDMELKMAGETTETKMKSNLLLDEANVVVDVEELKVRLEARKVDEIDNLKDLKSQLQRLNAQKVNVHDSIASLQTDLAVENCDLMKKSTTNKIFRCVAVDKANAAGDSILGKNSGGVETFIACEAKNIHLFKLKTGELLHIFIGDDENRFGTKIGHTKSVTCLVYDEEIIYSGSVDETIIAWNARNKTILHVFEGHEGSITAIATCQGLLVSASADLTTRIWDVQSGNQLRVLYGHMKSVLSLELGPDWLLTGSADEEARVWSITKKIKNKNIHVSAETIRRFVGHEQSITCIRYGKLEVLTGDSIGRIFIWWMATGQIIRKIEAHKGPIRTMQFDSVHVVSGGSDHNVCITDLATGEVMQTLRSHQNHILFIGFDSERLLSISSDNTMRVYKWGSDVGPQDKYHTLGVGESLMDAHKITNTTVADIMKWNDIKDTRQLHPGMRLIVGKGNPEELTRAEKLALDRERRLAGKMHTGDGKDSLLSAEDAILLRPSRIHRLVKEDNNPESLANRLFGQAKLDSELFPTTSETYSGPSYSVSKRLQRKHNNMDSIAISSTRIFSKYLISAENIDEWGLVSDNLMLAMIEIYVESETYFILKELLKAPFLPESITGRMQKHAMILPPILKVSPTTILDEIESNNVVSSQNVNISEIISAKSSIDSGGGYGGVLTILEEEEDDDDDEEN